MKALNIAASGMTAQQLNVDTISNNIANVNTTAFKKSRMEFKDLLYDTMQKPGSAVNNGKPIGIQVGSGVMPSASYKFFTQGTMMETKKPLDLYIEGEGFFEVKGADGQNYFTKDGSLQTSVTEDGKLKLVTQNGDSVLDAGDNEITFDTNDPTSIDIAQDGKITYTDSTNTKTITDQPIKLVRFANPAGLENKGMNLYVQTDASGVAASESNDTASDGTTPKSVLHSGFLEASNVEIVEEMTNLITAQRAYEINSKTVQAADEMLGMANNLRR